MAEVFIDAQGRVWDGSQWVTPTLVAPSPEPPAPAADLTGRPQYGLPQYVPNSQWPQSAPPAAPGSSYPTPQYFSPAPQEPAHNLYGRQVAHPFNSAGRRNYQAPSAANRAKNVSGTLLDSVYRALRRQGVTHAQMIGAGALIVLVIFLGPIMGAVRGVSQGVRQAEGQGTQVNSGTAFSPPAVVKSGVESSDSAFFIQLPPDWQYSSDGVAIDSMKSDFFAKKSASGGGYADNLIVARGSADATPANVQNNFEEIKQQLSQAYGATNFSALSNVTVGGESGVAYTYQMTMGSHQLQGEEIAVSHNGSNYVIALTTVQADFGQISSSDLPQMLSTWSWT